MRKSRFERYEHHPEEIVWVRSDLKGKHKEFCLCYSCIYFMPGNPEHNCRLAQLLYSICRLENMVTPVWECPEFTERIPRTS